MRILSATAMALTMMAGSAIAAPVGFSFNAGPVLFVEDGDFMPPGNAQNLTNFENGEDVIVEFTVDSETPAEIDDPGDTSVDYFDPFGQIILRGAMSGAEVFLDDGVRVELSNFNEFDLSSFPAQPLQLGDLVLADDTDYRASTDFLTDPFDLEQSLAELDAILNVDGSILPNRSVFSTGVVAFFVPDEFDGPFVVDALEFGPVATPVPAPAGLPLLLGALGVFAFLRRRA